MNRVRVAPLLLLYGGYLLIATLYPFALRPELAASGTNSVAESIPDIWQAAFSFGRKDFILNIFLFIPCGALFYYLFQTRDRGRGLAILFATFSGAVVSVSIELTQLFVTRQPSMFDVLSNTLGSGVGTLVAALWSLRSRDRSSVLWPKVATSGAVLCTALLLGTLPLIFSVLQFVAPFGIWNPRFSFQIGNEATLNRPWLGKIHFVALYNRALSTDEVMQKFRRGFSSEVSERSPEGLISLYRFIEGKGDIVHDLSGSEPFLDLVISPNRHVRWLDASNGVEILEPAIIKSRKAGTKLFNAFAATHELSIEVWITPRDTVQAGPARIVSFSRGTRGRNFTLGQEGSQIAFRLRTPISGRNGAPLVLQTTNGFSPGKKLHVLATYKNGVERLYLNGKQQSEVLDLTSEGIIGFGTRKTPITQIAYTFFYFFPASFFFAGFLSIRFGGFVKTILVPVTVGTGLVAGTEVFQAFVFERVVDIPLIGYATVIATVGALSGRAFVTKRELVGCLD